MRDPHPCRTTHTVLTVQCSPCPNITPPLTLSGSSAPHTLHIHTGTSGHTHCRIKDPSLPWLCYRTSSRPCTATLRGDVAIRVLPDVQVSCTPQSGKCPSSSLRSATSSSPGASRGAPAALATTRARPYAGWNGKSSHAAYVIYGALLPQLSRTNRKAVGTSCRDQVDAGDPQNPHLYASMARRIAFSAAGTSGCWKVKPLRQCSGLDPCATSHTVSASPPVSRTTGMVPYRRAMSCSSTGRQARVINNTQSWHSFASPSICNHD